MNIESKGLVLIVDDEAELREVIAIEFQMAGWTTTEAKNAVEALAIAKLQSFDLIVSDVRMPGGGGVDLVAALRSLGRERPAIFLMSGFSDLSDRDIEDMGVQQLFHKPFDLKSMSKAAAAYKSMT